MKLLLFVVLLAGQVAFAQEASENAAATPEIIEIRKSLPMEPTEKSVKDFIINRGSSAGLKPGAYVNVVRDVAVNDPVRNKALGSLKIPVGKLQLIHVENNISVARLHSELGDDERPTLEYEALMIGDNLDLNSISMEAPKSSKKKWSTAAAENAASATAVQQTAPTIAQQVIETQKAAEQPSTELASMAPSQPSTLPSKVEPTNEPAFIITPIESEREAPVKEKTSFIPTESATVTAATTAN